MKALVFGGLHHLGAHVVAELRGAGHDVAIIDVGRKLPPGESDIVSEHIPTQLIVPKRGVDLSAVPLEFDPADFDVLFVCGIDTAIDDDSVVITPKALASEVAFLRRLLSGGPKAVVLASSASVYVPVDRAVALEEETPPAPEGRLGAHALELERAVTDYADSIGASFAILRTSIVAGSGPGVLSERRVSRASAILPGLEVASVAYPDVTFRFDGHSASEGPWLRDFVHASDAAAAHRLAADLVMAQRRLRLTLHVGSGQFLEVGDALSMRDFVGAPEIDVRSGARFRGSGPVLDIGAAGRQLGWAPIQTAESVVRSELEYASTSVLAERQVGLHARVAHEFLGSSLSAEQLTLRGVLVSYDPKHALKRGAFRFVVNGREYKIEGPLPGGVPIPGLPMRVMPYVLHIPAAHLDEMTLQNPLQLVFRGEDGSWFDRRLTYSGIRRKPSSRRSRLYSLHEGTTTLFVRQTSKNRMYVTVRALSATDERAVRRRILTAKWASVLRRRPVILVYEKECAGYEESGAAVFEALIDRGRTDVRYVLDRAEWGRVPEKYRSYLVERFSWEHFYLFFCARTLLGTESPVHAAELRTADRRLLERLTSHRFGYVFLQHGVMYMVALSSAQRSFFRAGNVFPTGSKVVSSSVREARHLIDQGGFPEQDVYVCGLPKFDRAFREDDASTILISPTWQPWEANNVRAQPEESLYYRMLHDMFDAVPEHLRDRIWILPHRLFRDALVTTDLADRMWMGDSYDEALRGCALLLTDYSSIAYDAFYRGANVVFWWKEKDYCMQQYGGHLMLDEHSAFGPVCFEQAELADAVASAYGAAQDPEYVERFREIVEFHDGGNTDRLLGMLERDGLI